jgi:hypothetical protein
VEEREDPLAPLTLRRIVIEPAKKGTGFHDSAPFVGALPRNRQPCADGFDTPLPARKGSLAAITKIKTVRLELV